MSEDTTLNLLSALKHVSFQSILNNLPIYCNPQLTSVDYTEKAKFLYNYHVQSLKKYDFSHLDQFIEPKQYNYANDIIFNKFSGQNKYKKDLDGFNNMESKIQKILLLHSKTNEGRKENLKLDCAANQTTFLFTNIFKIYVKALKIAENTFMKSINGIYCTETMLNNKPPFGDETKLDREIQEKN
ncbi:hypothetical protein ILUMI_26059 [Ignelater luminosus]|uniref:Uncharacterized protein n=1 Tax=Ignelater luminosus TaxID=2038154 RepID=A0A8K0FZG9_IGNLU|nr:hypothetical protein ILUMI_26059 [Ignelater luminosus]